MSTLTHEKIRRQRLNQTKTKCNDKMNVKCAMWNEWINGLTTNHSHAPLPEQKQMWIIDAKEIESSFKIDLKHVSLWKSIKNAYRLKVFVVTPLWGKCEDEIRTPKSGNLESSRTPETLKLDCRGQNISPWSNLHIVGKVLKCKLSKMASHSHLDICSTSYGRKKGWKSN